MAPVAAAHSHSSSSTCRMFRRAGRLLRRADLAPPSSATSQNPHNTGRRLGTICHWGDWAGRSSTRASRPLLRRHVPASCHGYRAGLILGLARFVLSFGSSDTSPSFLVGFAGPTGRTIVNSPNECKSDPRRRGDAIVSHAYPPRIARSRSSTRAASGGPPSKKGRSVCLMTTRRCQTHLARSSS